MFSVYIFKPRDQLTLVEGGSRAVWIVVLPSKPSSTSICFTTWWMCSVADIRYG